MNLDKYRNNMLIGFELNNLGVINLNKLIK